MKLIKMFFVLLINDIEIVMSPIIFFGFFPSLLNNYFSEALIFSFFVGSSICFNLTSNDVLHSFGLNSLYTKVDCVPGVLHSLYVNFFYSGIYIVYCTELCGVNHSVMPLFIVVG